MVPNRPSRSKFKECHSFARAVTPGWKNELYQTGPDPSTHGGVVSGELLQSILFREGLRLQPDDNFVDIGSSTGIITNSVNIYFGIAIGCGIERDYNRHRKAIAAESNICGLLDTHSFYHGDMTDPIIMKRVLCQERLRVWFNNYGRCMEGTIQTEFEQNLEQFCLRGTRVASFSELNLSKKHWKMWEKTFLVENGDLSWTGNIRTKKVFFYQLTKK